MGKLFDVGYYTEEDMKDEGFKSLGKNVRIAKNCTIVGAENISIGSNVRIDGYSTLIAAGNGYIDIGSFIHIGSSVLLIGGDGIVMEDFSAISHGAKIYSRTDDMSGEYLTNPMVPEKFTNVFKSQVTIKQYAVILTLSIILPGVTIGEGAVVGAQTMVKKSLDDWGIYYGRSARKIKNRSKKMLELKEIFLKEIAVEN